MEQWLPLGRNAPISRGRPGKLSGFLEKWLSPGGPAGVPGGLGAGKWALGLRGHPEGKPWTSPLVCALLLSPSTSLHPEQHEHGPAWPGLVLCTRPVPTSVGMSLSSAWLVGGVWVSVCLSAPLPASVCSHCVCPACVFCNVRVAGCVLWSGSSCVRGVCLSLRRSVCVLRVVSCRVCIRDWIVLHASPCLSFACAACLCVCTCRASVV